MTSKFQQRLEWLNVWGGGTLMGMLAADVVIGSYNAGVSPFKPSLFTPLVFVFCVTVGLLSRPRFCLAALLLLALPVFALSVNPFMTAAALLVVGIGQSSFGAMQATLVYVTAPQGKRAEALGLLTAARTPADKRLMLVRPTEGARRVLASVLALTGWGLATSQLLKQHG